MDAPFRRPARAALLLPLVACAACGCALFDRSTDKMVEKELKDRSLPGAVARGQQPDGPLAPAGPITLAPAGPTALTPAAPPPPAAELPIPTKPAAGPIQPVVALSGPPAQTQVRVVATVAGELIVTDDEVAMMMKERARDFVALVGEERERKERQVYKEELKKLIERELIIHDFVGRIRKNKPAALDEVWDQARQQADRQIREFRKLAKLEDEAQFQAYLQQTGTDAKLFKRFFERTQCMSIFVGSLLKDTGRGVALQQIETYYKDHPDEFAVADRVKWQHLFVSAARFGTPADARLYADWLRQAVADGRDVAELAKQYGHGDSALRNGDGLGDKPGDIRPAELEPALFKLKAGEVSAVIPDANGFHVLKAVERDVAGTKPLDDKMQQAIRNRLADKAMRQERDRIVTELWRKYTVAVAE